MFFREGRGLIAALCRMRAVLIFTPAPGRRPGLLVAAEWPIAGLIPLGVENVTPRLTIDQVSL